MCMRLNALIDNALLFEFHLTVASANIDWDMEIPLEAVDPYEENALLAMFLLYLVSFFYHHL